MALPQAGEGPAGAQGLGDSSGEGEGVWVKDSWDRDTATQKGSFRGRGEVGEA